MITSKFSVIAILIITGICFGVFVYPYMKKKREAALIAKKNYPEFVKQYLKYNQRKGNEVR